MAVSPRELRSDRHVEIASLIRRDINLLIDRWRGRAVEEQPSAARAHHERLLDHLPHFLRELARSLAEGDYENDGWHGPPAREHGDQRWEAGWSLEELVRDYQLLRLVVQDHLEEALPRPLRGREVMAIDLALDEAIAASVARYAQHQEDAARRAEQARAGREQQEQEARYRQQADSLREENRRKDEFLALLGHELRNPLAPLRHALHVLHLRGADPPTVAWAEEVAERQAQHLTRLADDLLDVSRISRGKILLRHEPIDLGRLVGQIVEDHRRMLEGSGLALTLDLPQAPVWVSGDPIRLTQVVGNLINNAVKFTDPGGSVTVRVGLEEVGGRAQVVVRDTGLGIDADMLPRVFDLFMQADRSVHRSRGGLGLGLALVRGLVELHGGEVRAESAGPSRGATFTVLLPVSPEVGATAEVPAAELGPAETLRVLLVEDNRDAAETLRVLLELWRHQVVVAHTGPAGVEAARQFRPDVVICDLGLPGMDGFAVARALRQNPDLAPARLIALTGYGSEADQNEAHAAGFERHLTKPVDPDELKGILRAAG